jgi:hypothetical protein
MGSDSQNKNHNLADNIISLNRHEFVTEIEQKLAKARRFFSLQDYVPCEELVRQVLKADPQNSKAKALLDLTAIKLSRRKLYQKIVSPQIPGQGQTQSGSGKIDGQKPSPDLESPSGGLYSVPSSSKEIKVKRDQEQEAPPSVKESAKSILSQADFPLRHGETSGQTDTLRERTISALVELFKEKEKSLREWRDPRFVPRQGQSKGNESAEPDPFSTGPSERQPERGSVSLQSKENQQLKADRPADKSEVVHLPDVRPFDQITPPREIDYKGLVKKRIEEHSEDLSKGQIKTVTIAQIKKYLYQEEYELCALELEKVRKLFHENAEIQTFVENTSRRLAELQRIKGFETQAKELMASAITYYQEGKLPEGLIAAKEVLRVIPNHQQAKEFIDFVQKRLDKENKKKMAGAEARTCASCGVVVDSISIFCFHCGKRLDTGWKRSDKEKRR